jgi:hypothetical protein
MVIQNDIHHVREEPDQHVIRLASRVSRTTTVHEIPTKSNLGPYSQDEVLAPSDRSARSSSYAASFSL